jgi:ribosomal protein S13
MLNHKLNRYRMAQIKSIGGFLKILKAIGEDVYISELKGAGKLTETQQSDLREIIAGIQNDLGELDSEIFETFNIKPYEG